MSRRQGTGRKRKRASSRSRDPTYHASSRSSAVPTSTLERSQSYARTSERLRLQREKLEKEYVKQEQLRRAFAQADPSIPPTSSCPLLAVPSEIRECIYDFLFDRPWMQVDTRRTNIRPINCRVPNSVQWMVPILKTCRLIRHEAQSALCKRVTTSLIQCGDRSVYVDPNTMIERHKVTEKNFRDNCIEKNPILKFSEIFNLSSISSAYVLDHLPNVRVVLLDCPLVYHIKETATMTEMATYLTSNLIYEKFINRYLEDMEARNDPLHNIGWEAIKKLSTRDRVQIRGVFNIVAKLSRYDGDPKPLEMWRSFSFDINTHKIIYSRLSSHNAPMNEFKSTDDALMWLWQHDWEATKIVDCNYTAFGDSDDEDGPDTSDDSESESEYDSDSD